MRYASFDEEESPPKMSWDYDNLYFTGQEMCTGLPGEVCSQWVASVRMAIDSRTPICAGREVIHKEWKDRT